jgi:hypothetical protein
MIPHPADLHPRQPDPGPLVPLRLPASERLMALDREKTKLERLLALANARISELMARNLALENRAAALEHYARKGGWTMDTPHRVPEVSEPTEGDTD